MTLTLGHRHFNTYMSSQTYTHENPSDDFLIAAMVGGDVVALRQLMKRYDRLVRYHVYRISKSRCLDDPHWLDGIASEVWSGFVERCRRHSDETINSMAALLSRIARNCTISALRRTTNLQHIQPMDPETSTFVQSQAADEDQQPHVIAERLELLEALQDCLSDLNKSDRRICDELSLIMERRWKEAGRRLDMSESTLRSRWKSILDKLRHILTQKT